MSSNLDHIWFDDPAPAEAVRRCFVENGILIVRGLLAPERLEAWRISLRRLIVARVESLNGSVPDGADLDEALHILTKLVDNGGMDIIRVVKDLPQFYQVMSDPKILRVVSACLETDMIQAVHDVAQFRIDPPDYYVRNFGWHQDYQYNVASLESTIVWFPLTEITEDMGYLGVIPKSHDQIVPVIHDDSRHKQGMGTTHSVFRLDLDENELERRAIPVAGMKPGDVAFFHGLLLHRGGVNKGTRARWVVNPRFAKGLDPAVVGRGWLTMRDRTPDAFLRVHPDKVRRPGESPG